jgi:capsular exopolysaccharide synthesis family protein
VLGTGAAVALVMQLVPGRFTADALLKVSGRGPGQGLLDQNEPAPEAAVVRGNQEAIIRSTAVLKKAVDKEEVARLACVRDQTSPEGWLARTLKVEFKGPEIVQISLSGDEPKDLPVIVNAVAEAYEQFMRQQEEEKRKALLDKMEANAKEAQTSLRDMQRDYRNRLLARKVDDPETAKANYESKLRQLDDSRKQARDLRLKEIAVVQELRGQKDLAEKLTERDVPEAYVNKYLKEDLVFKQHLANLALVEEKMREIRLVKTPDVAAPIIEQLQNEKALLFKALAAYRKAQLPGVLQEVQSEARLAALKLERDLEGVRTQKVAVETEVKRLEDDARRTAPGAQRNADLEELHKDIEQKEDALKRLREKIETLKLTPALGGPVTRYQDATEPKSLDRSRQMKLAGGAGLGAFVLLLFGVAFLEFRTRKISSAGEVSQGLGLNLVGTLPALPDRARRLLPGTSSKQDVYWQNLLTESVDAIRTLMLHAARTDDLQVVLVTSASGGEGKTSLASQLAASLARAWRKTLLIDGDLRNPAIHKLLGQPLEPGFSEVLRGEVGAPDAVRPTSISRLWMMPAGHWDSHAVQALAQESVRSLFEQLKDQYDFIIIDSCPLLPVADSLLLAQHVDGVLLSVLRDVSRAPAIHAAQQRLEGLGVRTLGAVVIGTAGETGNASYLYQSAGS